LGFKNFRFCPKRAFKGKESDYEKAIHFVASCDFALQGANYGCDGAKQCYVTAVYRLYRVGYKQTKIIRFALTAIIQEVVSLILESTQPGSIEGLTVNPYQARAGVKMHWLALALLVLGKRAKNIDRQRQCRSSATCTTCSCPSRLSTVF
jgi:hypothetical protein